MIKFKLKVSYLKKVKIIGIDIDEPSIQAGRDFAKKAGITWPNLIDPNGKTKSASGVRNVPYFGYFKEFPKSRITIAKTLEPYGVTIHSLRKTYAYFLKSNNVHVTTAAKFIGHSNPLVTLKIYTLVRDVEVETVGNDLRKALKAEI